jgi:hypothetical protein
MARPTRLRENIAAWATGTTVTPAEFDAFDERCYHCFGELGGVFAIESDITLGTSNPAYTFTFSADVDFTGAATFDADNLHALNPSFSGTVAVDGSVTATNVASDDISATGDLVSSGAAIFNGSFTVAVYTDYINAEAPSLLTGWAHETGLGSAKFYQTLEGNQQVWHVVLPTFATITEVGVMLCGAGGHGGLPENMPQVKLYRHVRATGANTLIFSEDDSSGSTVVYDAVHELVKTGLTEACSEANEYVIRVCGESGANYVAGLTSWGLRLKYSATKIFQYAT